LSPKGSRAGFSIVRRLAGILQLLFQHDYGVTGATHDDFLEKVEYGQNLRTGDPVKDAESVLPAVEDAALLEDGQVLGDVRLLHVQSGEYLTHAPFTVAQVLDDGDPGGMAQRLENVRLEAVDVVRGITPLPPADPTVL